MKKLKETDLRIGNYVKFEHIKKGVREEYSKINFLGGNSIGVEKYSFSADYKAIRPIPITDEWLNDLGFENKTIKLGEYVLMVTVNAFSGTLTKDATWFISIVHVSAGQCVTFNKQYIHELQNLFYSLANKELTKKIRQNDETRST